MLDCLVVGAGPVGLTAALYLRRFRRTIHVVDSGTSRAALIPASHNIPFFARGVPGTEILEREREHARLYGIVPEKGEVTHLDRLQDGFAVTVRGDGHEDRVVAARTVLLATGGRDVEPDLPDAAEAVRAGLIRYCPICDGSESADLRIGVLGRGGGGLGEAQFLRRTYCDDVTLLAVGAEPRLDAEGREALRADGIECASDPVAALERDDGGVRVTTSSGDMLHFDAIYSALGVDYRSSLAVALGAEHDAKGKLVVDGHGRTSVHGLYAAGDVASGLDQIVVGMGQAARAATHIHNHGEGGLAED